MKYLILLLISFNLHASVFIVNDPCTGKPNDLIPFTLTNTASVQDITVNLLNLNNIPFESTQNGIISIYNTPQAGEDFDIVDENNMKSYGWCYEVDSYQPNVTSDRFIFNPLKHREITWLFGMAQMVDGKWISYCKPISEVPDNKFCK